MKVFTTDKIRNVVVLGHSGAGKTSLVSAMNGIATASKQRMTEPAATTQMLVQPISFSDLSVQSDLSCSVLVLCRSDFL